jgi:hypothetical protein
MHTLAEVYATMTALPVKDVIPPDQALLFVQEARDRLTVATLTEEEYYTTIERAAAAKVKAETIYTWNLKHFRAISPALAVRIQSP